MVCKLIDFALAVLKLLMLEICRTIHLTKIELSNISGTERVSNIHKASSPKTTSLLLTYMLNFLIFAMIL